ncbi:MAG: acyl-[Tidjanibacter sp.]|nr:acyl-[acyl-carrier-protein] thioesterase [Tidjanibacter sp.]
MMEKKRTYTYRIEPYQADLTQRLTLMGLGDYLLTTASTDAMLQGYGNDMLAPNCGWVILRMGMEVVRLPKQLERIKVATWVSDVNRLATTRNFEVYDEQGLLIAHASTIWAAIDLSTRRTLNLTDYPLYCAAVESDLVPQTTPPVRLSTPEERARYTHQVLYSYIDGNGHTYSINYLRMALDSMPLEALTAERGVRVDINYMHETYHGERLTIITDEAPNPTYEIRSEQGTPACRLRLEWR